MRILHLVEGADAACLPPLLCDAFTRRVAARHRVWTLGATPPGAGLVAERMFAPRLGHAALAAPALRRPLARAAATHDALLCWSPGALLAAHAAALGSPRLPTVGVFTAPPPAPAVSRLGAALLAAGAARCTCVLFSRVAADGWRALGARDIRTAPARFDQAAFQVAPREDSRRRLGIAPGERAVLLLADPPRLGDARRFTYLAGLLGVGGMPVVALAHAASAQARRALRFHRGCGRAWRLILVDEPLTSLLPAADAALIDTRVSPVHPLKAVETAPGHPALSADALAAPLAAAARVPLLMPPGPLADELRAMGHRPVVASSPTALSLASAVFSLATDTPPPVSGAPQGIDALDALHEIVLERLNVPLPGFPLRPEIPVPPLRTPATITTA